MRFVQTFKVRGSSSFPFDMLRYDACFPATETASYEMVGDEDKVREVELKRYIETKTDMPTVGRWESFCWAVIDSSIRTERR